MDEIMMGDRMIIISQGKRSNPEKRRRKGGLSLLWFITTIVILMGADAYMRSITTNLMYRVSDANVELEKLNSRKQELAGEIASLRNPRRIEKIALMKLGLMEPDSDKIIKER